MNIKLRTMTTAYPALLLSTLQGLLLQVSYEPRDFEWRAILRLPPSVEEEQAGIPGMEVMRVMSINPPRFHYLAEDKSQNVFVFVGPAMFSLPRGEAERLRARVIQSVIGGTE